MSVQPDTRLPGEPTPAALTNPVLRCVMATRPAFLSVTAVGVLIGLASAYFAGAQISARPAALTMIFALVAHAGANVINDYYDGVSGCDAMNVERLFPFTGGSRFIQNGVLSPRALGARRRRQRFRRARDLRLPSRRGGARFALLVANVLYINQFPDLSADALAGKRTLVVRLGPMNACWGSAAIGALAYLWPLAMVLAGRLPAATLVSLAAAAATFAASRILWGAADRPKALAPALPLTIIAANANGLLMAAALAMFG